MTDITDMSTSRFNKTGRRNRVLDECHRLMNRDIFINHSIYVIGPHDIELQDDCWYGYHYKKVVRPKKTTPLGHTTTRVTPQCRSLLYIVRSESFLVLTKVSAYRLLTTEMESQTFILILMPTPL